MNSQALSSQTRREARTAYELGRLRRAVVRSVGLGLVLAILSLIVIGQSAVLWLPVFLLVWTALEWRGGPLLRGGRIGAIVGALLALMPVSVFMSCCRLGCSMASGVCCNTARACGAIGALVGLFVTFLLARLPARERMIATGGAALGLVATSVPRCSGLMLGEGVGLLLGLLAGALAAGLVCRAIDAVRLRKPA
jgi:hypothetical protein